MPPTAIVDQGFVAARAMLLDVAAFLDRVERYGAKSDFRCEAMRSAAKILSDGKPERARRILERLSDPTRAPLAVAPGGAACGAWKKGRK